SKDKRLRRLHLTEQGLILTQQALGLQVTVIEDMMGALSEEECQQLGDFMRRVGSYMLTKATTA
ncbi:MAG: hypothetical protein ACKVON_12260, partial [Beijerinckiaceae bacterium]